MLPVTVIHVYFIRLLLRFRQTAHDISADSNEKVLVLDLITREMRFLYIT